MREHPFRRLTRPITALAQDPSERTPMKAKNVWHHRKAPHPPSFRALKRVPEDAAEAAVGRTAYSEEYQRDRGPDRDEPVDRTESGDEF